MKKKLIVVGGGAAGFFCAVNAARLNPHLEVMIVEKTSKILSKVKVSGGGRCNVTHACFDIGGMVKNYPRGANFLKKAFHQFFTTDTIQWFKERGVLLKTETDGRMFPVTNSSQTIIDCLLREANKYSVQLLMNSEVRNIQCENKEFRLELSRGDIHKADYVCIACGGYPKLLMYEWLKQTTHTIEEPVPSLFTFNVPGNSITALMGVSVQQAKAKIFGTKLEETGPLLITHWGLSGPAILKLSARGARELAACGYQFKVMINWIPEFNEQKLREKFQTCRATTGAQKVYAKNEFALPQRLWEFLCKQAGIPEYVRWADFSSTNQHKLINYLLTFELEVKGKTTFKEEFVTAGGIKLSEIDVNTMMSKLVPNLFFAGEMMDVDGITGGFNFQHAWTSGWIAAKSVAEQSMSVA